MKKKIIIMLLAITMTALPACGQRTEEAVSPQIGTVESTDEIEGDEEETDGEEAVATATAEAELAEEPEVDETENEEVSEDVDVLDTRTNVVLCHPADYLNPFLSDYLNPLLPSDKLPLTIRDTHSANYESHTQTC